MMKKTKEEVIIKCLEMMKGVYSPNSGLYKIAQNGLKKLSLTELGAVHAMLFSGNYDREKGNKN